MRKKVLMTKRKNTSQKRLQSSMQVSTLSNKDQNKRQWVQTVTMTNLHNTISDLKVKPQKQIKPDILMLSKLTFKSHLLIRGWPNKALGIINS